MLSMTRIEAIPYESMKQGMPWDWVTFPEFLASVEHAPKANNILPYVPLAPLLVWVMGMQRAKAGAMPTAAEQAELFPVPRRVCMTGAPGHRQRCESALLHRRDDVTGTGIDQRDVLVRDERHPPTADCIS